MGNKKCGSGLFRVEVGDISIVFFLRVTAWPGSDQDAFFVIIISMDNLSNFYPVKAFSCLVRWSGNVDPDEISDLGNALHRISG